jgi:hypothetical protein
MVRVAEKHRQAVAQCRFFDKSLILNKFVGQQALKSVVLASIL